jgi:hypothetical protein
MPSFTFLQFVNGWREQPSRVPFPPANGWLVGLTHPHLRIGAFCRISNTTKWVRCCTMPCLHGALDNLNGTELRRARPNLSNTAPRRIGPASVRCQCVGRCADLRLTAADDVRDYEAEDGLNAGCPPQDHSARPSIGDKHEQPNPTRSPGSPWAICITTPPHLVMYSSDAYPGRIYKLSLDGRILGVFGKSGKQLGSSAGFTR